MITIELHSCEAISFDDLVNRLLHWKLLLLEEKAIGGEGEIGNI